MGWVGLRSRKPRILDACVHNQPPLSTARRPDTSPGVPLRKAAVPGAYRSSSTVYFFIIFIFSASRAHARFREVVLHGTKDVENEFRVSEMYLGVRGSSRFVAESDLAFFGLAGLVTTAPGPRVEIEREVAG